ncbi:MAG: TonB-dependent receptor plug domain-containing protein [Carboxylicivirga sp.]|nr:TonB-dependent receptor plug domain-containing protein [Carboxylicivirga sp.]
MLAQHRTITGKVVGEDQIGLPGVNVIVKGTTLGTITNVEGGFTINLPEDKNTLVFSFIGFTNKEVLIEESDIVNVTLESEAVGLNEVIAVGYGTQIKSKITSAVTSVDEEVLEKRPVGSVQEALAGAAPGLIVNTSSGAPGRSPSLSIRGVSTIGTSSGVLVLIDGIEGSMDDISPAMVKSISVLKDASAAAIYGARAANGVILVTTKQGSRSKKTTVNYSFDLGIQSPVSIPDLVSSVEYMEMKNRALGYEGKLPEYSDAVLS